MILNTFARLATTLYMSGKTVYLKSGPGRGKTTTILEAVPRVAEATGKNLGTVVISAPLLTPADTVGYLVPVTQEDGRVESKYTDPFWWRTEDGQRLEEYDGGIIFIDEMDKADVDVKKLMGEMALSGRCGPHKLPPGWVVWMAGNRSQDRSGSTKELDHLINRRFEVEVTDDLAGWEDWALQNDVHHTLVSFAVQNPNIVFPESVPEKQGPFCTPRSLVETGKLLLTLGGNNGTIPTDTDAIELAAAGIGQAAAAQLFATIRLESELPKIETIIANPDGAKMPSAPDAQMLVAYKLAALADDKSLAPIIKYVERLPADFSVTFAKALCKRKMAYAATPAMLDWAKRNGSIMATMSILG
jgi:hypothetical protein